jgi:acid phosphatase class B
LAESNLQIWVSLGVVVLSLGGKKFFSPEHFEFGRKENFFTRVVSGCVSGCEWVKNLGGKKFFSPEHFDFGRKEIFFTGVVGVWWVCGGFTGRK